LNIGLRLIQQHAAIAFWLSYVVVNSRTVLIVALIVLIGHYTQYTSAAAAAALSGVLLISPYRFGDALAKWHEDV